ncbi:MAG: hypothetical protein WKF84_24320 [Pyrinomonadaceae bacterium]
MSNNEQKKVTLQGRINRRSEEPGEPKSWWTSSRRTFLIGGVAAAGVTLVGGGVWLATRDETVDTDKDSLELQQTSGWNVGSEEKRLSLPSSSGKDSQQSERWKNYLDQSVMLSAYQPKAATWMPFFVPTLIQSLQFETLRTQLAPISTPDMEESYGRAQSIARDFIANAENAGETAVVVDLPDAQALPSVRDSRRRAISSRSSITSRTLWVSRRRTKLWRRCCTTLLKLKASKAKWRKKRRRFFFWTPKRLEPYKDADAQFDNRYTAKLPSAQKSFKSSASNPLSTSRRIERAQRNWTTLTTTLSSTRIAASMWRCCRSATSQPLTRERVVAAADRSTKITEAVINIITAGIREATFCSSMLTRSSARTHLISAAIRASQITAADRRRCLSRRQDARRHPGLRCFPVRALELRALPVWDAASRAASVARRSVFLHREALSVRAPEDPVTTRPAAQGRSDAAVSPVAEEKDEGDLEG